MMVRRLPTSAQRAIGIPAMAWKKANENPVRTPIVESLTPNSFLIGSTNNPINCRSIKLKAATRNRRDRTYRLVRCDSGLMGDSEKDGTTGDPALLKIVEGLLYFVEGVGRVHQPVDF